MPFSTPSATRRTGCCTSAADRRRRRGADPAEASCHRRPAHRLCHVPGHGTQRDGARLQHPRRMALEQIVGLSILAAERRAAADSTLLPAPNRATMLLACGRATSTSTSTSMSSSTSTSRADKGRRFSGICLLLLMNPVPLPPCRLVHFLCVHQQPLLIDQLAQQAPERVKAPAAGRVLGVVAGHLPKADVRVPLIDGVLLPPTHYAPPSLSRPHTGFGVPGGSFTVYTQRSRISLMASSFCAGVSDARSSGSSMISRRRESAASV